MAIDLSARIFVNWLASPGSPHNQHILNISKYFGILLQMIHVNFYKLLNNLKNSLRFFKEFNNLEYLLISPLLPLDPPQSQFASTPLISQPGRHGFLIRIILADDTALYIESLMFSKFLWRDRERRRGKSFEKMD